VILLFSFENCFGAGEIEDTYGGARGSTPLKKCAVFGRSFVKKRESLLNLVEAECREIEELESL